MAGIELSKDSGTLYGELVDRLKRYIREEGLGPGRRFPSHRQIADMAGVSRVTARLAVKQLEKEGILESCAGQGTFLRRVPADDGGQGERRITRQVGVVLSIWARVGALSWNDSRIIPGILEEAANHNVAVQLIPHELAVGDPGRFDRYLLDRQLDGLIWLEMQIGMAITAARWVERGLPQVCVQRRVTGIQTPLVSEDNYRAARHAARILLDEGHQRVLVTHPEANTSSIAERLAGVRDELDGGGVGWPAEWFVRVPEWPYPRWLPMHLREALERVRPTAVLMLEGGTSELVEAGGPLGLEFGRNCRLVSFHPPAAVEGAKPKRYTYFWPRLREIGQQSVALWLRAAREMESQKDFRPDWTEWVEMEAREFPPSAAELHAAAVGRREGAIMSLNGRESGGLQR